MANNVVAAKNPSIMEPTAGSAAINTAMQTGRAITLPILAGALFIALWEFICVYYQVRPVLLPSPSRIVTTLIGAWDIMFENAIPTTVETVIGFVLSVVFGSLLAVMMVYSRILQEILYPNIVLFQLIPKIAVAPLFIMWLGIEWQSRVTIAVFIAFFPIAISTWTGLMAADASLLRLCRSLRASEWQVFTRVRVPSSLPFAFNGMKISMTLSIIGVIVGEFITSQQGLGYVILFAGSKLETALVMAAILVL